MESLSGAKLRDVQWDPDRACLHGTRTQLLDDIFEWLHDPDAGRILWLSGPAGTGKSSVANSVAERLHSLGRLGASFRFDRDVVTADTPGQLFGNLCYQLAHFDDQFRAAMLSAILRKPSRGMSLKMLARTLLVEPIRGMEIIGPVVIVIDALDESGADDEQSRVTRETLVRVIVEELPTLPTSVKVLITSRDEGSISRLMPNCPSSFRKNIVDDEGTREDILKYIQFRMREIRKLRPNPLDDWPGLAKESALAHYSDGLFIWAHVACTFLQSGYDPDIQLEELLKASDQRVAAEAKLDRLYTDIINRNRSGLAIPADSWHYVVDSIVALKTPLTVRDMDLLLGLSVGRQTFALISGRQIKLTTSYNIISSLRPILRIDAEIKSVVRLLHKSVFDFFTDRADESIRVDLIAQNGLLAMQCLEQMNHNLRYDICGISNISLLNSEVDEFSDRIRDSIPEALRYACRYFANHLSDVFTPLPALMDELHKFVTQKLLYWIEIMGLLNQLPEAEVSLQILSDYLKVDLTSSMVGNSIDLNFSDSYYSTRHCGNYLQCKFSFAKLWTRHYPIHSSHLRFCTSSHSKNFKTLRNIWSYNREHPRNNFQPSIMEYFLANIGRS